MRSITPVAILAILALAPLGAAQVPLPGSPTPVYTLTLTTGAAAFTGLEAANATAAVPFTVSLVLGNVVCPAAAQVPITITATATGAPANLAFVVEPSVVNVTVAEGPHVMGANPATGAGDGVVNAVLTGNVTNATVSVALVATAPAPAGCAGAGAVGDATSEPVTLFANMTAPPPPPEPTPESDDTPFVGFLAVAAVAVAVACARRRQA